MITPPPTINGLILYLTYDQTDLVDRSGNNNNANGTEARGPGYSVSRGHSAHFQGEFHSMVAPSDTVNNAFDGEFSVSFWIFSNSLGTLTTEQCPIVEKGDANGHAFNFAIDVSSRQFIVNSLTNDDTYTTLVSNGHLQNQRWTHIAVTRSSTILTLYINGILDAVVQTSESAPTASRPLYFGRRPWQDFEGGGCTIDYYFDEFKLWDIVVAESWIEAESGTSIDPHSIELGCINCSFSRGLNSCTDGFHLCTTVEVYSFAFNAAKSMGWLRSGQRFWSDASLEQDSSDTGLAV